MSCQKKKLVCILCKYIRKGEQHWVHIDTTESERWEKRALLPFQTLKSSHYIYLTCIRKAAKHQSRAYTLLLPRNKKPRLNSKAKCRDQLPSFAPKREKKLQKFSHEILQLIPQNPTHSLGIYRERHQSYISHQTKVSSCIQKEGWKKHFSALTSYFE